MVLKGKHLVLRGLEREDLKLLHGWQNDEEVMRLARSFPDHTISMEALQAEYEKELKGDDTGKRTYIIEEQPSRKPLRLGYNSHSRLDPENDRCRCGSGPGEEEQGEGVRQRSGEVVVEGDV